MEISQHFFRIIPMGIGKDKYKYTYLCEEFGHTVKKSDETMEPQKTVGGLLFSKSRFSCSF